MLRFRLRTLFVVMTLIAVALGWVAWQRQIIRQRRELLDALVEQGATYVALKETSAGRTGGTWGQAGNTRQFSVSATAELTRGLEAPGSWSLRGWLGDVTIARIWIWDDTPPDTVEVVRRLAPEAAIESVPAPRYVSARSKR